MDFQLDEEQTILVAAVQSILQDHTQLPQSALLGSCYYDVELQELLRDNGFLDTGRDIGALEAVLVIEEAAKIPAVTEVAGSALIAPQVLGEERVAGPVALVSGQALAAAHRYLSIARTALVDLGNDVGIIPLSAGDVTPVDSVLAYPYGRFARVPEVDSMRRLPGAGNRLRQWWRVGLTAEFAGAAQSALNHVIEHVKQRHAFGRPIGTFQAVQHRLVQCQFVSTGVRWLALRAAWSGEPHHADLAACYAQQHVRKLLVDLHQFTGAMGVTNEFLLHFWTYRLRALQSEAGGLNEAAREIAAHRWSAAP
jgi:hypothetical protein